MTVPTVEITVSFSLQCIRQPDWFVKQNLIMSFSCSNRSRIVNFQGRRRLFQFYGSKTGLRRSLTFLSLRSFFTDWSSSFPPPSGPLSVTEIHQGIFCFFLTSTTHFQILHPLNSPCWHGTNKTFRARLGCPPPHLERLLLGLRGCSSPLGTCCCVISHWRHCLVILLSQLICPLHQEW